MIVFKTLKRGAVIPETWKTSEVSPPIAPAYCFETISRPWHREEKPRQYPAESPELKRWS